LTHNSADRLLHNERRSRNQGSGKAAGKQVSFGTVSGDRPQARWQAKGLEIRGKIAHFSR